MVNEISGDSDEYWFLSEAVELSKDVEGMCCEIGLRLGMGTKTIMDAVREHCSTKLVVSVDPFGNIPYTGREPDGETHYDYTDYMRNKCMKNMWSYVDDYPIDWRPMQMSDKDFFQYYVNGIPRYHYNGMYLENKYSMIHLDGPHYIEAIKEEILWFNHRMDSGATIVIDDITPDFINFEPIQRWLELLNFEHIKTGGKKSLWQKK